MSSDDLAPRQSIGRAEVDLGEVGLDVDRGGKRSRDGLCRLEGATRGARQDDDTGALPNGGIRGDIGGELGRQAVRGR
jgi:hypothetical protein